MIDWTKVNHFLPKEFPEDPDLYASEEIIYALDKFRRILGKRIFPSKASGALARLTGSPDSQHYALDRESTAVDFFCEGSPIEAFHMMLLSKCFTGIGIYLCTNGNDGLPWVMFHGDVRDTHTTIPKIWIVERIAGTDRYRYPQRLPQYWELFRDKRLYVPRFNFVDHR